MRHLTIAALLAVSLVGGALSAAASPPACPGGWTEWDVATEPYQADNATDENGNGIVCAKARGNQTFADPDGNTYQIYNFKDDGFGRGR
jgi:hypothetical protein